jgi:hypothetical protein
MSNTCAACGKPIYAANHPYIITLTRYWTHYSWWANRSHNAIPRSPR